MFYKKLKLLNMEITKEIIEDKLGYEINNFELQPLKKDGKCIGLKIKIEPKCKVQVINTTITIEKTF